MYEMVVAGGWMMLPIILCSIATIGIGVERYWSLSEEKVAPRFLLAQVWEWLSKNQLDGPKVKHIQESSPLGQVLAAGLSNSRHGREVMIDSMQIAANQVLHHLERYLNILGTIYQIAPLLGLLGTITGMIKIFAAVMNKGSGDTAMLAGGISEALIATAGGMFVAIPALILYRFYLRRVDGFMVSIEQEAIKLVDALHSDRKVKMK